MEKEGEGEGGRGGEERRRETKGVREVSKKVGVLYIQVHISILTQICQYYGDHEVDPDERDAELQPKTMAFVSKFIGKHLKGVATAPSIFEICMYADTVSGIQLCSSFKINVAGAVCAVTIVH